MFYTTVGGDAAQANVRLDQIVKDSLRSEFSKRTIQEVVSGDRDQIMETLSQLLKDQATSTRESPRWTCGSNALICRRMSAIRCLVG